MALHEEEKLRLIRDLSEKRFLILRNHGLLTIRKSVADAFVAMEGALKLKEIAYIPTQEYPAGEMKHGPLALVTSEVVSIFGATDPNIRDKVVSNIKEVQARGGKIIAITTADDEMMDQVAEHVIKVPRTKFDFLNALLAIIPLQLFAYHVAKLNGCDIDQPRNLAKSVTVE